MKKIKFRTAVNLAKKYLKEKRLIELRDYLSLYKTKGLTEDEYNLFEFKKRSPEFRKDFLGVNEQRQYLDVLNPKRYYILSRNKFMAHKMMENTGIRTSELYCYYQPMGSVASSSEIANDVAGVVKILQHKGVGSCVIKSTESSHGENVWVIKQIEYKDNDAMMTRYDGQVISLSEVLKKNPLIFESLILQTPQLAAFNESSVNTIRFMTMLYPNGEAKVIATFIKIGRMGKCVDNAGGGGNVDVCVDVESGEVKYAIQFDGWQNIKEIEKHPDSGSQLNGVVIENWEAIKDEVKMFQQAFPYCRAAGWDIAITPDGPLVIEVNDFWDRTGQYFIRKGWRNEIRDCYRAWKKAGDTYSIMGRLDNRLSQAHLRKIENYE